MPAFPRRALLQGYHQEVLGADHDLIERIRALRTAGELLRAEDAAHAHLHSLSREARAASLRSLAAVFTGAREHWARPYTFPAPEMVKRAEAVGSIPLADAFASLAEEDPEGLSLLIAAATVLADYGSAGDTRKDVLGKIALRAQAAGRLDDALAAAQALVALTPEDEQAWELGARALGSLFLDCGRPEEALPVLERYLAMLEELHARRPIDDEPIREVREMIERVRRKLSK